MSFFSSPFNAPFGFGTPASGIPLADEPIKGALFINAGTGDYEHDPVTLRHKEMPSLRQRVLLRVKTLKNSSSVLRDFGIRLPDKMGSTFAADIEAEVRSAFRQETDVDKVMEIQSVTAEKVSSGRAEITISYVDLLAGQEDEVTA